MAGKVSKNQRPAQRGTDDAPWWKLRGLRRMLVLRPSGKRSFVWMDEEGNEVVR